jgi:hypothetical protein
MQGTLDSDLQLMGRCHIALNQQNVSKIITQVCPCISFTVVLLYRRINIFERQLQISLEVYSNSNMTSNFPQPHSISKQ